MNKLLVVLLVIFAFFSEAFAAKQAPPAKGKPAPAPTRGGRGKKVV